MTNIKRRAGRKTAEGAGNSAALSVCSPAADTPSSARAELAASVSAGVPHTPPALAPTSSPLTGGGVRVACRRCLRAAS